MSEFSWTTLADTCRRFVRAHDDPHVDDQILGTILRNLRDAAGAPAEITDCLRELFTVPLSAMFHTYEMGDAVVWSCKLGGPWIGEDPSCRTDTTANSESAAQSAAVAHLESVHGIRAAEESAGEFSWTAIADQCRRFVCAHDDPDVDDTILGTKLRNLRDVVGVPAVFPGEHTVYQLINSLGDPAEPGQCGETLLDMQLGRNVVCVLPAGHDLGWHASRQVGGAAITWGHAPDLRRTPS